MMTSWVVECRTPSSCISILCKCDYQVHSLICNYMPRETRPLSADYSTNAPYQSNRYQFEIPYVAMLQNRLWQTHGRRYILNFASIVLLHVLIFTKVRLIQFPLLNFRRPSSWWREWYTSTSHTAIYTDCRHTAYCINRHALLLSYGTDESTYEDDRLQLPL